MKTFLSHEKPAPADHTAEIRKERRFYIILSVLAFIPGAFALWEIDYELWNIIGSIACHSLDQATVQIIRMLPLYVTGLAYIFVLIYSNGAYRAKNEKARRRKWAAGGAVTIILGIFIAAYVIVGVITHEYGKLVEGFISPLFPLDIMIGGFMFVGIGLLSIRYSKVLRTKESHLPYVDDRGLFGLRLSTIGVLRALSLLLAMCGFAACIRGFWVLDLSHGYIIYSIVLWLNFFTAFAMYFVYKYVFCEAGAGKRKTVAVRYGCGFLIVNIILFALHIVTVQIWNEAPNVTAFGLLPADFTASKNVFAVFYGANNILAPVIAIIRGKTMEK